MENGMFVLLNSRTFAIMDVLKLTKEELKLYSSEMYPEQILLNTLIETQKKLINSIQRIDTLEQQIRELQKQIR